MKTNDSGAPIVAQNSRRLFPHAQPEALDDSVAFVTMRLLEEGDARDLGALFQRLDEAEVARIFTKRGGRQLSRRSREFWALVLGVDSPAPHPASESLWLL